MWLCAFCLVSKLFPVRRLVLAIMISSVSWSASADSGWEMGTLTMRNIASLPTFKADTDLTYNPRVATRLSLSPSLQLSTTTALSLGLGLSREWTRSDIQTTPNEVWLNDPSFSLSYAVFNTDSAPIRVTGASTAHLPLSPPSRAASRILQLDQSLTAVAQLERIGLSYTARLTKFFHQYTTGQLEAPRLGACQGADCFQFMHTGVRNTDWSTAHIFSVSHRPLSRLRLTAVGGIALSNLYPLTAVSGLPEDEGPSFRYATLTQLSARIELSKGLSMQAGVENYYAQLHPDGSRQAFFFNRYANVFLDLVVSDALFAAAAKGPK